MKNLFSFLTKTGKISNNEKTNPKDYIKIYSNDKPSFNNDYFYCPKCKERVLITLNPSNFNLSYNCENNHKEYNIDYNIFYNKKYIHNNSDNICQICKKENLDNKQIIKCTNCNKKLCEICIMQHKNIYNHNNFELLMNITTKKCIIHNMDISHLCKTCNKNMCIFCLKKNKENNEHYKHEILNFSDIIPDENEIKDNNNKLKQKILKNNLIIDKLKKWKEEMCSLIDEIIDKLNKEKLIYQILIGKFNWKFLDYVNYENYNMAIKNLEINNKGLENFYKSKMFIEQTNAITDYLFGKNYRNNSKIENDNSNEQIINEKQNDNIIINGCENNKAQIKIISTLKSENALLYYNNGFYSFSLENNFLINLFENPKEENENEIKKYMINNNINVLNILKNFIINLSKILGNYNILIWEEKDNLNNDKIINKIRAINQFKNIKISNNNNFNIISNIKNIINNNKDENKIVTINNLFNKKENSLFNFDDKEKMGINNSNINNESTTINTNINLNDNIPIEKKVDIKNNDSEEEEEIEEEEEAEEENDVEDYNDEEEEEDGDDEYVYISRTGFKYHGSPQCGRMKSSTMVTRKKAESLGLEPCMKCY